MSGQEIMALADWSTWVPLLGAEAPREAGVYLIRQRETGLMVYVGMAGPRQGDGLRGRLRRYTSGKALASGLGEAVFDRALADAGWVRARLAEIEADQPLRATGWGKAALMWADLEVCWAVVATAAAAVTLEKRILGTEGVEWWNRSR